MAYSRSSIIVILHITISITLCVNSNGQGLPKFPAMIIFGDSILDTGMNNYVKTFMNANHRPYGMSFPGHKPTGRWSDGKLMSDYIVEALGIKELMPPFLHPGLSNEELKTGVNFASAGSGWDETTNAASGVVPVTRQLQMFKQQYIPKLVSAVGEAKAKQILNNCLVYVLAGSNDYFTHTMAPPNYDSFLHGKIRSFIQGIYESGVRNLMVAGIPPFPQSTAYNPKLKAMLAQLQSSLPGSRIVYADIAAPMTAVTTNGGQYGISIVGVPCCGGGCMSPLSQACPNPQNYYSFDGIHPTQAVYKVMSRYLLQHTLPQFNRN